MDVLAVSAPAIAEGRATNAEEQARIAQIYNTRRTEAITFAQKMGIEPVFLTDAEGSLTCHDTGHRRCGHTTWYPD